MKHPIKVVMLPTKDKTNICIAGNIPVYITESSYNMSHIKSQHIYITISQDVEPIKEGDWYYSSLDNHVKQSKQESMLGFKGSRVKIIATDDPKLTHLSNNGRVGYPIPQVQQSFLKEYVANPDGDWEVECETETKTVDNSSDFDVPHSIAEYTQNTYTRVVGLKLNQDNTVNINFVDRDLGSLLREYLDKESRIWDFNNFLTSKGIDPDGFY